MFTSWSEQSTPAELSMKSVQMWLRPPAMLTVPPTSAYSTRPRWVRPRLPPSPITFARSWAPLTRTASLALVADVGVRLLGGLDVGADAAVPQQVHRRPQDRPDQLVPAPAR